ncbi:MAG: prolyl oligopeptidase family serine peptidase [Phycisphaerae bacterium]|nr:prolyl oligopeptidase family serine peptidase [Phycisphaerae bacterium]
MVTSLSTGCLGEEDTKVNKPLPPGQHDQAFEKTVTRTLGLKYLLYLPKEYGTADKKWPLILFLHGAGERGDNLRQVELHGPPKIVKDKDLPFIIVSPQCPRDSWWPKQGEVLISMLDDIVKRYNVDTSRIYLTGLSMGGYGTWSLACDHPQRFAAIAPICGGGEPLFAPMLRNVPVWAFHGAKDNVVPLDRSEVMVQGVKRAGGDAQLTVYPEAAHDSWTATYNNPELYEWFLKHTRKQGVPAGSR